MFDGPGGNDIDFQSDLTISTHWSGFYDHESEIAKYRVVLHSRCLTDAEITSSSVMSDFSYAFDTVAKTTFTRRVRQHGTYYASVIAFNYAMEPSMVSCSDGIVLDPTPPVLKNVRLLNGFRHQTVACGIENDTWVIWPNQTKSLLWPTQECKTICINMTMPIASIAYSRAPNGTLTKQKSSEICSRQVPLVSMSRTAIHLPSDLIHLEWDTEELETQMYGYEVGICSSTRNVDSPDIIPYHNTHNHTYYRRLHSGLGHGSRFFIALKAINKARLVTSTLMGPIFIDQTPPEQRGPTKITFNETHVEISWSQNTFYDQEDDGMVYLVKYAIGKYTIKDRNLIAVHVVVCHQIHLQWLFVLKS